MIASVARHVFHAASELAPAGVDLRELPDGREEAEFIVPDWEDRETVEALPWLQRLRVVQALSAGTDWIEELVPPRATLCNARGARDAAVAEWVVGALLGDAYGLLASAGERHWSYFKPRELQGSTVLIVGYGSIGQAVDERLASFGVDVVRVARTARSSVHGPDELRTLVGRADAVVVLAPLTGETRGLFDTALLGRMRDGALLVNAGRGAVVDTDALVAELRSGRIRAVLDVVDPEPLPDGHPLWELASLITPHNAGDSPAADERAVKLAAEQLARYARGQPLLNVVRQPAAGN